MSGLAQARGNGLDVARKAKTGNQQGVKPGPVGPGNPPASTVFQPGQSGNPNGRPVKRPLTEALKRLLAGDTTVKIDGKERKLPTIDALMRVAINRAMKGDPRFMREILDRVDGKVLEQLDLTSAGEKIGPDLAGLSAATKAKVLKELGGPEE